MENLKERFRPVNVIGMAIFALLELALPVLGILVAVKLWTCWRS